MPDDTHIDLGERVAALEQMLTERTRQLDACRAELAARNSEYGERIEHQSATIDVLKAMSASPGDPQPVFDLIVRRARDLCNTPQAGLFEFDGELVHLRSHVGAEIYGTPDEWEAYKRLFPMAPTRGSITCRAILDRQIVHVRDLASEPGVSAAVLSLGHMSQIALPLLRDGAAIGAVVLTSTEIGGFTDSQVALLQTFAEQAVIAITSAETYRELQQRTGDLQESLEYQTATSEVLNVIARSTSDVQPVLDTVIETAARLCGADTASITIREGEVYRFVASSFSAAEPEYWAILRQRTMVPGRDSITGRVALEGRIVHIEDLAADPDYAVPENVAAGRRTGLGVPLLREGAVLGTISLARSRVEPFTERQIELVRTFADQAVIAIENARLLTELRESLEQQTATAEVLQVINSSPGELQPVFEAILEKAHSLCGVDTGSLQLYDGEYFRAVAVHGRLSAVAEELRQPRRLSANYAQKKLLAGEPFALVPDFSEEFPRSLVARAGVRTVLYVALRQEKTLLGFIAAGRSEVRPFSDKQITLLQNYAAQAVIAMDNARLLGEIRQRQAELRVTFDNMGDGVAMFDAEQRLAAWNRNFQQMLDLPDTLLTERPSLAHYIRHLATHGEYGEVDVEAEVHRLVEAAGTQYSSERTRPDGSVIEVRANPVPGGGVVIIYSDITERKRAEAEIRAARDTAEKALHDLRAAQASLIHAEKMASLGQLTAGIAHEIKNPLNFVNNFAGLSVELLDELKEAAAPAVASLGDDMRAEIDEIVDTLSGNLTKIGEHGRRADGIVTSMLAHSRGTTGERQPTDINALVEEALNLAYHGARAQDQEFNIAIERDFAAAIAPIELAPQDVTRVFLNLFGNGFYAARKRARETGDGFRPALKVTTRDLGEMVEIRVRDNGAGIAPELREKLFQPFFTTKPPGEGTGLGLSISWDIVTQQHGGAIAVDSRVGQFTEFTIRLPRSRHATMTGRTE